MALGLTTEEGVSAETLRDDQLAVVFAAENLNLHGKIVQRYDQALMVVGERSGLGHSRFFSSGDKPLPEIRVRILTANDVLRPRDNE